MITPQEILQNIRHVAYTRGIKSDRQMERLSGLSLTTIKSMNRGHYPSTGTLLAYAEFLGCDPGELLRSPGKR